MILNLVQGTPEWHAHRAKSFNASDAAAMLGVSPHKTRAQLLEERATGITPEVSEYQQRIFDAGHEAEAYARPLAEKLLGEDLYPCVVTDGRLSASLDGLTLDGSVVWECKLLNEELRQILRRVGSDSSDLPLHHRVQMEQQLLLSGAEKCLFTSSDGQQGGETYHRWYTSDPALRARVINGWEHFEADLAEYTPKPAAASKLEGVAPEHLPALRIELTGTVLATNLQQFREHAFGVLRSINRDLRTDQDFVDAEEAVKWCSGVESRIDAAKQHALSQTTSIEEVFRELDAVKEETRRVRLSLAKLVADEKQARRNEIVQRAADSVRAHYARLNEGLGEYAIQPPQTLQYEIGTAIKGRKTLATITDAAETAAADAKIEATQRAERVRDCIGVINQHQEHISLLPDRVPLAHSKTPDDLRNLITARVAEHERIKAEQAAQEDALRAQEAEARSHGALPPKPSVAGPTEPYSVGTEAPPPYQTGRMLKLGEINAAIAPLSISGAGLSELGFDPTGHEKAAKLYDAAQWPAMRAQLLLVLQRADINGKGE